MSSDFLQKHGWELIGAVGGDMSPRKYFRVSKNGRRAIFMDCSGPEAPGHKLSDYVRIAEWLRSAGEPGRASGPTGVRRAPPALARNSRSAVHREGEEWWVAHHRQNMPRRGKGAPFAGLRGRARGSSRRVAQPCGHGGRGHSRPGPSGRGLRSIRSAILCGLRMVGAEPSRRVRRSRQVLVTRVPPRPYRARCVAR